MSTLLQNDVGEISSAIASVLGVSLDEMTATTRMQLDKYPAKVALCHLLHSRGHRQTTIAHLMGVGKSCVYAMLHKHDAMLYGDPLYKRAFGAITLRLANGEQGISSV